MAKGAVIRRFSGWIIYGGVAAFILFVVVTTVDRGGDIRAQEWTIPSTRAIVAGVAVCVGFVVGAYLWQRARKADEDNRYP